MKAWQIIAGVGVVGAIGAGVYFAFFHKPKGQTNKTLAGLGGYSADPDLKNNLKEIGGGAMNPSPASPTGALATELTTSSAVNAALNPAAMNSAAFELINFKGSGA